MMTNLAMAFSSPAFDMPHGRLLLALIAPSNDGMSYTVTSLHETTVRCSEHYHWCQCLKGADMSQTSK